MASLDDLMSRLMQEAGSCYSWSNGPHDRYAAHSHPYEKVLYCIDGSITFVLELEESSGVPANSRRSRGVRGVQRRLELKPGDKMVLPAGTEHSAVVGPAGCTCIEGRR